MFILDTDFIFSYFDKNQSTHLQAVEIVQKYGEQKNMISNLTKQEIATVISRKIGQKESFEVIKNLELFEPIETGKIWELFWSFNKKNISFVDCSNLFLAKKYNCQIASFDQFYSKGFLLI